jgi:succinate dehydrogenase / fumarate reductase membrane anchor subunit
MARPTSSARARGLGAAHEGLANWKLERLTSIALVPLVLWFVFSAWALAGSGYQEIKAWLGSPISASLMILLIIASFYHAQLGVQVVIEDYVHHRGLKIASLLGLTLVTFSLAVVSVVAVLQVSIGS